MDPEIVKFPFMMTDGSRNRQIPVYVCHWRCHIDTAQRVNGHLVARKLESCALPGIALNASVIPFNKGATAEYS